MEAPEPEEWSEEVYILLAREVRLVTEERAMEKRLGVAPPPLLGRAKRLRAEKALLMLAMLESLCEMLGVGALLAR